MISHGTAAAQIAKEPGSTLAAVIVCSIRGKAVIDSCPTPLDGWPRHFLVAAAAAIPGDALRHEARDPVRQSKAIFESLAVRYSPTPGFSLPF